MTMPSSSVLALYLQSDFYYSCCKTTNMGIFWAHVNEGEGVRNSDYVQWLNWVIIMLD